MPRHEIRDALRWLSGNPGFTTAAGLVLALSIGLTTATFSVVYTRCARRPCRRIRQGDPRMPIARQTLMSDLLAEALGPQQFSATLLAAFAWIAVVLAAAGLWGLIAYTVARRTREFGIRIALGATPRDVMRMAAGRGFALAATGVALGLVVSAGLSGVLERLPFGVSPTDRVTFTLIAIVVLGVATGASVLPARRALRIDPAEALRLE